MTLADDITLVEQLLDQDKLKEAESKIDILCDENSHTPSFKILILKAQILLRTKQFEKCQSVASKCLELAYVNGKRPQIAEALKILSMSYFRAKDYSNALKYILHAASFDDSQSPEIRMFKNMVTQKYMSSNAVSDEQFSKIEKDILSESIKFDSQTKIAPALQNKTDVTKNVKSPTALPSKPTEQNMRFDWFDSGKTVEISIYVKKIQVDSVVATIKSNSVRFKFKDNEGFDYQFNIGKLYSDIDETKTSYKVYGTKLQVDLIKKDIVSWHSLSKPEDNDIDASKVVNCIIPEDEPSKSSLSYPTSSTKKTDWSKFAAKDDDDNEDSEDPEAFFKKLYQNADDDARRAMMKSMLESNGTSLSTDWKDVGSREVKPFQEDEGKPNK